MESFLLWFDNSFICINPRWPPSNLSGDRFDVTNEADKIVNIVSGRVAPVSVNVDKTVTIGTKEMEEFEGAWPDGFYNPILKKTVTMQVTKKHVNIGTAKLFNTTLLFSRVIGLQASCRDTIDIKTLLSYAYIAVQRLGWHENRKG